MRTTPTSRRWIFVTLAAAIVAGLWATASSLQGPVRGMLAFAHDLGAWAPLAIVVLYVPASLAMLPSSILTIGCGFFFGVAWGTGVASLGATLGASVAFCTARALGRERLRAWLGRDARFAALDAAVAERGFFVVFSTRLSVLLPFGLLNYAFGLSRIGFGRYVAASWLGMLPGGLMYAYLGSTLHELGELASGARPPDALHYASLAIGLALAIFVTVLLTRMARKALADLKPEA